MEVVGLDAANTAKALGINPTAVRVARHRGLGRLRKLLAEDQPFASSSRASR
jgi:RNA polymerase sigma-70 factor (ECF subfamily)